MIYKIYFNVTHCVLVVFYFVRLELCRYTVLVLQYGVVTCCNTYVHLNFESSYYQRMLCCLICLDVNPSKSKLKF